LLVVLLEPPPPPLSPIIHLTTCCYAATLAIAVVKHQKEEEKVAPSPTEIRANTSGKEYKKAGLLQFLMELDVGWRLAWPFGCTLSLLLADKQPPLLIRICAVFIQLHLEMDALVGASPLFE
jgi:hypothetical protein